MSKHSDDASVVHDHRDLAALISSSARAARQLRERAHRREALGYVTTTITADELREFASTLERFITVARIAHRQACTDRRRAFFPPAFPDACPEASAA